MIRKILAAAFLLALSNSLYSQSDKNSFTGKNYVRFNFFGLLDDFDKNLSFGSEHYFRENWSAGSDVGWIFHASYLSQTKSTNGVILRPFIRFYPGNQQVSFIELELHYKFASYKIQDWIGRDPDSVTGIPAYEEFASFHYKKNVFDVHFKGGVKVYLSKDKKFGLECVLGIGTRWKWQGVKGGVYLRNNGVFGGVYNPKLTTLVVPASVRFVYEIN